MRKLLVTAAAAMLSAIAAVPAGAVTIDVTQSINNPDVLFYQTTQSFTLDAGFTNASLNITSLNSDDAAVVTLNGVALFGAGIFGPGAGNFYFTQAGPSQPFVFAANGSGGTFAGPFVTGTNTLNVIVNNTNAGINPGNGPLVGGASGVTFIGNVTYDTPAAPVIPEPATWAMMLLGFGLTGLGVRRRKPAAAIA